MKDTKVTMPNPIFCQSYNSFPASAELILMVNYA